MLFRILLVVPLFEPFKDSVYIYIPYSSVSLLKGNVIRKIKAILEKNEADRIKAPFTVQ